MSGSKLYNSWRGMIQRCYNKSQSPTYKEKNIVVCDEWKDFRNFHEWAIKSGYSVGLSIDRINNNGNYEPSNCRFITIGENSRLRNLCYDYSKRKPLKRYRFIKKINGEIISIKNYAIENNIVYNTFRASLVGMPVIIDEKLLINKNLAL